MAIETRIIQVRRGMEAELDKSKFLPGEFGSATDTQKIFHAFAPNKVKELASKDDVQGLIDGFTSVVDREIAEAEQRIESKAETVLGTIPDAYETVSQKADEAVRTKADAIVCTVSGVNPIAKDSSNDYLRNLKLYGKTTQGENPSPDNPQPLESVGKWGNLINVHEFYYSSHATVTHNDDGSTTVSNKTSDVVAGAYKVLTGLLPKGKYTINSWSGTQYCYVMFSNSDYSHGVNGNGGSYTFDYDGESYLKIQYNDIAVGDTVTFKTQITYAEDNITSYRPYTGQREVESGVYGKNLCPVNNANVTASNGLLAFEKIMSLPIGTYTISGYVESTGTDTEISRIVLYNVDEANSLHNVNVTRGYFSTTVTTTTEINSIRFQSEQNTTTSSGDTSVWKNVQIERGTVATEYEPYTHQSHISLVGDGLKGIPVTDESLATYTDEKGQMWCSDYVDCEVQKRVDNTETRVYDGSDDENWVVATANGVVYANVHIENGNTIINGSRESLCSHYIHSNAKDYTGMDDKQYMLGNHRFSTNTKFVIRDDEHTTSLETFKAFLAENPITLTFRRFTPIETPLTADEIASYKALHSNYKVTSVMNDCECYESITYNADTETWINNKIEARVASALASIAL